MSIQASRKMHPDSYRDYLRAMFLHFLANSEKVSNLRAGLQPMWERVRFNSYDSKAINQVPFRQLSASGPNMLAAYKAALMSAVSEELWCRHHGVPADWVCDALHGFVTGEEFSIKLTQVGSVRVGELDVVVSHVAWAMVGAKIDGVTIDQPVDVGLEGMESDQSFLTPALSTFSEWKELKRAAHAQLDILLNKLEAQIGADTEDWKGVYRKGHTTRLNVTMPLLVSWLVDRDKLVYDELITAHTLLKELELDNPPRASRKKSSSRKRR